MDNHHPIGIRVGRLLLAALLVMLATSVLLGGPSSEAGSPGGTSASAAPAASETQENVQIAVRGSAPGSSRPAESVGDGRIVHGFDLDYSWCMNAMGERRLSSDLEFLKLQENCDVMHSHAAAKSTEITQEFARTIDIDSCKALRAHYALAPPGTIEASVAIADLFERLHVALAGIAESRAAYVQDCINGGHRLARRSSERLMDSEQRMQRVLSELMDLGSTNTRYDGRMFERYVKGASLYELYSLPLSFGMYPDMASASATIAGTEPGSKARSGDTITGMRSSNSSNSFSPISSWRDVVNWLSTNRVFDGRTTGLEIQLQRGDRRIVVKLDSDQIAKSLSSR